MNLFAYRGGRLHCEELPVDELAERFGTPLYVYSAGTFRKHYARFTRAFAPLDPLICFSVKSCANLSVLRLLGSLGSGFDVVSGGELFRALQAGAPPEHIVFAGVGKTQEELTEAMQAGVGRINVESESELSVLSHVARRFDHPARVAVRIIPEVDARTPHHYTTTGTKDNKFGVPIEQAAALFRKYARVPVLRLCGLHLHIGSPVRTVEPYETAIGRAVALVDELRGEGFTVDTLDIGGGFPADYERAEALPAAAYAERIVPLLEGRGLRVVIEPGRCLAANAGILLTRVIHTKDTGRRRFVIVDAAMTELIRPALYDAYHFIWPTYAEGRVPVDWSREQPFEGLVRCDVVGPVCESGDFLARDRALPALRRDDLVAIFTCGAYAMSMSSQYNSRPRAAEVLVDGREPRLIRRRETYDDLVQAERV